MRVRRRYVIFSEDLMIRNMCLSEKNTKSSWPFLPGVYARGSKYHTQENGKLVVVDSLVTEWLFIILATMYVCMYVCMPSAKYILPSTRFKRTPFCWQISVRGSNCRGERSLHPWNDEHCRCPQLRAQQHVQLR